MRRWDKDIPSTCPNFTMHGYYIPIHAGSHALLPYPDSYQYPSNIQVNAGYLTHLMTTSSATSRRVGVEETPKYRETDIPCTSSRVEDGDEDRSDSPIETEDGTAGTSQLEDEVGGNTIEKLKSARWRRYTSRGDLQEFICHFTKYAIWIGTITTGATRDG